MYFDEPKLKNNIEAPIDMKWILSANALALLVIGLVPHTFMEATTQAVALSLH
jgi:NADH-quinone oxidoreductase subunit N